MRKQSSSLCRDRRRPQETVNEIGVCVSISALGKALHKTDGESSELVHYGRSCAPFVDDSGCWILDTVCEDVPHQVHRVFLTSIEYPVSSIFRNGMIICAEQY